MNGLFYTVQSTVKKGKAKEKIENSCFSTNPALSKVFPENSAID